MMFIVVMILIFLILLNYTVIFHPKVRLDTLSRQYTYEKDLWITKSGNKKLLVCLHGIYSTPKTFEELSKVLGNEGWDIFAPALPASALDRQDVRNLGAWVWEESLMVIRDKISQIPSHYDSLSLCGHSQGGSLAMQIATENIINIDSLLVIASPVSLYGNHLLWWENFAIYFAGILSFIFPKGLYLPILHIEERRRFEKHCDAEGIQIPLMIHTFKKGLAVLCTRLYKIQVPLFLAYCTGDKLVGLSNMNRIKSLVNSKIIEEKIYIIPKVIDAYSYKHQLLNHSYVKEDLFKTITVFLQKIK